MARTKPNILHIPLQRQRTSWTKFYLPCAQDWPTWAPTTAGGIPNDDAPRSSLGPLAGAAGCVKVWLGRQVEDPEQAVFVVVWESEATLKAFQASPAGAEFLQALPAHRLPPSAPTTSRAFTMKWTAGFRFAHDLHGRVTLTTLSSNSSSTTTSNSGLSAAGSPEPPDEDNGDEQHLAAFQRAARSAFAPFYPFACKDLAGICRSPYTFRWSAFAWADNDDDHDDDDHDTAGKSSSEPTPSAAPVFCYLWRWNGNGATAELEEASHQDPQSMAALRETVSKTMPPVTAWNYERWDFVAAPSFSPGPSSKEVGGVTLGNLHE